MRQLIALLLLLVGSLRPALPSQNPSFGSGADSLRFAVIGDTGTGDKPQYEVAQQMVTVHDRFPFEMVIMLGDNMYGRQQPQDFVAKFERPYAALLHAGVPFYAALGNHDNQTNRFYQGFNMSGERYYTFAKRNVRFFVLDSNGMDPKQLAWVNDALKESQDEWKICYFHHPIYSSAGRHGSDVELRVTLEPLLVRYGVNVVFAGHDHVYERVKPQKGIVYFTEGASGQLAKGDVRPSPMTAASFDQDQTFMLVGIDGAVLSFEAISRAGVVVDSGVIRPRPKT